MKITDDAPNAISPLKSKPDEGTLPKIKFHLLGNKRTITMSPKNFRRKYSNAGRLGLSGKHIPIDSPTLPSTGNLKSQF